MNVGRLVEKCGVDGKRAGQIECANIHEFFDRGIPASWVRWMRAKAIVQSS